MVTETSDDSVVVSEQWTAQCKDCRSRLAAKGATTRSTTALPPRSDKPQLTFTYAGAAIERTLDRGETRSDRCPTCRTLHRQSIRPFAVAYVDITAVGEAVGATTEDGPSGPLGGLGPLPVVHSVTSARVDTNDFQLGLQPHHVTDLLHMMERAQVVVLEAGTGTGKSTLVPYRLMYPPADAPYRPTDFGPIVVTEPRVLATKRVATYVSDTMCLGHDIDRCGKHVGPGYAVGYQCEGNQQWDSSCQLIYVTDGTMLNWITDSRIGRFSTIVIDEAHERSKNIDAILTLLAEQLHRYPRLRVVIASATIDVAFFRDLFDGVGITTDHLPIEAKKNVGYGVPLFHDIGFGSSTSGALVDGVDLDGKHYDGWSDEPGPVTDQQNLRAVTEALLRLRPQPQPRLQGWPGSKAARAAAQQALKLVRAMHDDNSPVPVGDIIGFLPGKRECTAAQEEVQRNLGGLKDKVEVYWLMKETPQAETDRATAACRPGHSKVIFSSNIAETSLTIAGLKYVIDSGLIRQGDWDPATASLSLPTVPHSRAGVRQRWGRVGRDTYGWVFPLYSTGDFTAMPQDTPAGSTQENMEDVILRLAAAGVRDLTTLRFPANFTTSHRDATGQELAEKFGREIARATRVLAERGALRPNGDLTTFGQELFRSRLSAEHTTALLYADRLACVPEVAVALAAMTDGEWVGSRQLFRHEWSWPVEWRVHARQCHEALAVGCTDDLDLLLRIVNEWQLADEPAAWAGRWWLRHDELIRIEAASATMLNAMTPGMSAPAERDVDLRLAGRARAVLNRAMYAQRYERVRDRVYRSWHSDGAGIDIGTPASRLTDPGDAVIALSRSEGRLGRGQAAPENPQMYGLVRVLPWACNDTMDPFDLMVAARANLRSPDGAILTAQDPTRLLRAAHPVGTLVRVTTPPDDPDSYVLDHKRTGFPYTGWRDDPADAGKRTRAARRPRSDPSEGSVSTDVPHEDILGAETNDDTASGTVNALEAAGTTWQSAADIDDGAAFPVDVFGEHVGWGGLEDEFTALVVGYEIDEHGAHLRLVPRAEALVDPLVWLDARAFTAGDDVEVQLDGLVRDHFIEYRTMRLTDDGPEAPLAIHDGALIDKADIAAGSALTEGSYWTARVVPRQDDRQILTLRAGLFERALQALAGRSVDQALGWHSRITGRVLATRVRNTEDDDCVLVALQPRSGTAPEDVPICRVLLAEYRLPAGITLHPGDKVTVPIGIDARAARSGKWPTELVEQLTTLPGNLFKPLPNDKAVFDLARDVCLTDDALDVLLTYAGTDASLTNNAWRLWTTSRFLWANATKVQVIERAEEAGAAEPATRQRPPADPPPRRWGTTDTRTDDRRTEAPETPASRVPAYRTGPPLRDPRTSTPTRPPHRDQPAGPPQRPFPHRTRPTAPPSRYIDDDPPLLTHDDQLPIPPPRNPPRRSSGPVRRRRPRRWLALLLVVVLGVLAAGYIGYRYIRPSSVQATINTEVRPDNLLLSADGRTLYTFSRGQQGIGEATRATFDVSGPVPNQMRRFTVSGRPGNFRAVLSSDGSTLYTLATDSDDGDRVLMCYPADNAQSCGYDQTIRQSARAIAASPNGRVYVAAPGGEIDRWNARLASRSTSPIRSGIKDPTALVVGADAATLFVAAGQAVTVVPLSAESSRSNVIAASQIVAMADDAPMRRLFAISSSELIRITGGGPAAEGSVGSLPGAKALAVTPDGRQVLVLTDTSVMVYDTSSLQLLRTVDTGYNDPGPEGAIAVSPDGTRAYLAITGKDVIEVLSLAQ